MRRRIEGALPLLGLTEDPAEPEPSTLERNLRAAGGLGGVVFFGTLVVNGDVPAWLAWPSLAAMTASVVGTLLIRLRRDRPARPDDQSERT